MNRPWALEARAYAKVNLCLAVSPAEPSGGPRAGWHRIASWFAPIELWDDVRIERLDAAARSSPGGMATARRGYAIEPKRSGLPHSDAEPSPCHPSNAHHATPSMYIRCWAADAPRHSPIDWPEDKDLAVRAHRLLELHVGRPLPIRLELTKRIPTGGGLGGGSSDAASVLRGVTRLFDLKLDGPTLRALSAPLGSDVAYFIPDSGPHDAADASLLAPPGPAMVRGFGDEIAPAASIGGPLTLIFPDFGCPTPAVYKAFDALPPREFREAEVIRLASPAGSASDLAAVSDWLFNDLEEPATAVGPRLRAVIGALQAAGHRPHLSGSGSTLFVAGATRVEPPAGCVAMRCRLAAQ